MILMCFQYLWKDCQDVHNQFHHLCHDGTRMCPVVWQRLCQLYPTGTPQDMPQKELLLDLAWCSSCVQAQDYVCKEIPTRYPPGLSSVVLFVNSVGEINTTVFNDINLASVTSLTMTKTGITTITPGAFDKFHNLRALNLHDNYISQVTSAWFSHKEVLEDLVLSNNSIEVLNDDSFRDLLGLLRLNLSQNQISNITVGSFRSLGKLRHLDLSNNRLRHLSVETLLPVNSTMLRLDGNLWDCSCAVYEFAIYLRELQRASLLENQMEVLCDHPVYQRGVPVWNVSKCETTTAVLGHTVANSHTLQPALTEEGTIDRSTLISLIVLYHRKQARKHLLVIRPSPETLERAKQAQTDCREVLENSKNVESAIANLKKNQQKCSRTVALLNQRVLEPEKVSQIYQIYSTGICQTRETSKRAKSAGPVLSRACPEVLSRRPDLEDQDGELEDQDGAGVSRMQHHCELHTSWAETEKEQMESGGDLNKDLRCEMAMSTDEEREWKRDEGKELAKTSEVENQHPQLDGVDNDDDELDALKTGVKYKVNLIIGEGIMEGNILMENTKDQEFLHSGDEVNMCSEQELEDILTSRSARHQPHQEGSDDFLQPLEDAENMPYLTIGTDPRTKSPNQEQMPSETSPEQTPCRPFRPIRRVLTWPPTAAQWKKQWAQNQQILDIFPKLTFITERTHQNSLITANPENIPQGTGAGRLPVHKPAREEATVEMVEHPKGI
ncbi:hypothetical protein P4O66_012263, partial [Electrophorus voltai]